MMEGKTFVWPNENREMKMKLTGKILTTGLVVGGIFGTMAIANRVIESQAGQLDTVLTGEERRYSWKYGDVFYKVKGNSDSRPLLLIHGFDPGASSYEWRKNVDMLAEHFHVYVIDLLGFGISDRPAINYTVETFTDLIGDFIKEVIASSAIVVAHGLPCAYVIANAYRRPQLFERLVLVTPPTTILQETRPGPINTAWKVVLSIPIVGQFIYNMLTTRRAIRAYLDRQGYYNPDMMVTNDLVEYIFLSAHQPHSHFPAASLLSHHLTMDVHEVLKRLQPPIVAIWGREGTPTPSEAADAFRRVKPGIDVRILDNCKQQPQDEQATHFNNLVREFASQPVLK
jgi:pimeloyl-ACP methyl ester carboxylesterase